MKASDPTKVMELVDRLRLFEAVREEAGDPKNGIEVRILPDNDVSTDDAYQLRVRLDVPELRDDMLDLLDKAVEMAKEELIALGAEP